MKTIKQTIKLGYREKEILCKLYQRNEMWINDIYRIFSPGKGSYKFVAKRIGNLNKKGLISIYTKYNPETKKNRRYVNLTDEGKKLVEEKLIECCND